jgi:hypothetical protein
VDEGCGAPQTEQKKNISREEKRGEQRYFEHTFSTPSPRALEICCSVKEFFDFINPTLGFPFKAQWPTAKLA